MMNPDTGSTHRCKGFSGILDRTQPEVEMGPWTVSKFRTDLNVWSTRRARPARPSVPLTFEGDGDDGSPT